MNPSQSGSDENLRRIDADFNKCAELAPFQIAALSGASKERASFCLDVINVINQNSALQQQADKITEALKNFKIENKDNNISDDNFHKDLKEDVNDLNKENKIDMEISDTYIKENSMESSN